VRNKPLRGGRDRTFEIQIAPSDIFSPTRRNVDRACAGTAAHGRWIDRACGSRDLHPVRLEAHGLRSTAGLRASARAHRSVSVQTLDLPLGSELLATPTQFEVTKVADRFIQRTADEGNAPSFKYLLVPFDMKVEAWNWRYAFSTSFGDETTSYHVGVVSTARIVAGNRWLQSPWDHEITATRAYKLILKSIAQITGHRGTGACILVTSLSLEELDRKSSEFCPDDRAALVAAGVLKEKEQQSGPGCVNVARRSFPSPLVTARRKLDDWLVTLR
jgi:predicted Zn-dependent protease